MGEHGIQGADEEEKKAIGYIASRKHLHFLVHIWCFTIHDIQVVSAPELSIRE